MKIAIIGGGIAGLAQGILLKNSGYDVTIFERFDRPSSKKGHAFLMNGNVIKLIESFPRSHKKLIKNKINVLNLKCPDGKTLMNKSLFDSSFFI